MKVQISQVDEPISLRISREHNLTLREAEMFNHAQTLGPVYVATVDDHFVACWGIIPPSFMAEQAYLWFWGPPVKFPIAVLRYSRKIIDAALERYDSLYGHCSVGAGSIRWMQWLGAEFGVPKDGLIAFEIKRSANG